jgi:molecular chaperone DnaK (HSP70)
VEGALNCNCKRQNLKKLF